MTPKGQAATQAAQPLQISGWMKTFSNSVWMMAPVGQACWQGAVTQCLQTSLIMSQRPCAGSLVGNTSMGSLWADGEGPGAPSPLPLSPEGRGVGVRGNCSMNFTCRQDVADSSPVLS